LPEKEKENVVTSTVKAFLAVSAIAISGTSAFADREELNSGFHGNTPYQIVAPQGLSPSAAKSYGQAPIRQATYIRGRGANAYGQARPFGNSKSIKVYEWGEYQGQDPDPNVRLLLRRDFHN
jgi:hypothetical protein